MKITKFEEMKVRQDAKNLAIEIFRIYAESKEYDFNRQIKRAAISISNNIAEGFERKTDKEILYFLNIAKGSTGEVRSMTHIAFDLKLITDKQYHQTLQNTISIAKQLGGLIKSFRNKKQIKK